MTEPRYLRTLIVPLGVALVFLVLTPKLCQRALVRAKQPKAAAPAPVQASPSGLVISTPAPAGEPTAPIVFPPGLDASRIQYLVEINSTFSTPKVMAVVAGSPVTRVLVAKSYFEKRSDESFAPTREGLINVNGLVESPNGWMLPVAKRVFVSVERIDDTGDGQFNVAIKWRWEPNAVGAELLKRPENHGLVAEFAGSERHWALMRFVNGPDHLLQ